MTDSEREAEKDILFSNEEAVPSDDVSNDVPLKKKIKQNQLKILCLRLLPVILLAAAISLHIVRLCLFELGVSAMMDGREIGTVRTLREAEEAVVRLLQDYPDSTLSPVTYRTVHAADSRFISSDALYEKLSDTVSKYYVHGYVLLMDGQPIGYCQTSSAFSTVLTRIRNEFRDSIIQSDPELTDVEITNHFRIESSLCRVGELSTSKAIYLRLCRLSGMNPILTEEETAEKQILPSENTESRRAPAISGSSHLLLTTSEDSMLRSVQTDLTKDPEGFFSYHVMKQEEYTEEVPYSTVYLEESELFADRSELVTAGENGISKLTYEVAYENGEEVSRRVIEEEVIVETTTRVIRIGTKPLPDAVPTGSLIWPVPYTYITSPYGVSRDGFDGDTYHFGIDIAADMGDPVCAADGGKVVFASVRSSYGLLVIIDHGGRRTYYAHMSKIQVKVGDSVYQGQQIGLVGMTGVTTGPHLHFEVRNPHGWTVNPLTCLPSIK